MADITLIQKSDLDSKSFKNDNTNGQGGIAVAVSPDNGNLLGLRNNGLYYGIEAPADTRNLHVHPDGDDKAAGTRAAPLRTIGEAIRRNLAGQRYTIHLYEGNGSQPAEYEWRSSWGAVTGHLMTFQPYGDKFSAATVDNPVSSLEYLRSQQLLRPKIKFISDSQTAAGVERPVVYTESTTSAPINFTGVQLIFDAERSDLPLGGAGFDSFFGGRDASLDVVFTGAIISLPFADDFYAFTVGKHSSLTFDACVITSQNGDVSGNKRLLRIMGGVLSLTVRNASQVAGTAVTGRNAAGTNTSLTRMETSNLQAFGAAITGATGMLSGNVVGTSGTL